MGSTGPRLGGMALGNGVLVHGPRHWSCAIRDASGTLQLASGRKSIRSVDVASPLLRGPARIAEVFALLPAVRRALPEVELPFQRGRVLLAIGGATIAVRALRGSKLSPLAQEAAAAVFSIAPAVLALRGTELAAYHGAEHISIGSYEHGSPRPREHERCGSHLVGPLLVTTAAGNAVAERLASTPRGRALARAGVGIASLVAASETLSWMLRHPQHAVSRALSRPGLELQHRFLTAEPTADQLEVAEAALAECLRLETAEQT